MRLERFARDRVAAAAARTADFNLFTVAEEILGIVAHRGREHLEHARLVAAAVPPKNAALHRHKRFRVRKIAHGVGGKGVEPGEVAIRMLGREGELLLAELEKARAALLALRVEL